jgi:hypothetical protein
VGNNASIGIVSRSLQGLRKVNETIESADCAAFANHHELIGARAATTLTQRFQFVSRARVSDRARYIARGLTADGSPAPTTP